MWKSEKHLCKIGKTLDANIDQALEELRENKESNGGAVYQAIKAYFWHRWSCEKCTIAWRPTKQEKSK